MSETRPEKILRDGEGHECYIDGDGKAYKTQAGFNPKKVVPFLRVYGNCSIDAGEHRAYPYASLRLKGQVHKDDVPHSDATIRGVDHTNVPIIQSKQHEKEVIAKYGFTRE
jgi:hypothetical protein